MPSSTRHHNSLASPFESAISHDIPLGILPYGKKYEPAVASHGQLALLPGHGEPDEGCGTNRALHCPICGSFWGEQSCLKRECPNCYEKWAAKEARVASKRLAWGVKVYQRTLYDNGERRRLRVVHCITSFKDEIGNINEIRQKTVRVAKRHGVHGGTSVVHHVRTDKYSDSGDDGDGTVHAHIVGPAFDIIEGGPVGGVRLFVNDVIARPSNYFDSDGELKVDVFEDDMWDSIRDDHDVIFKHIQDDEYKDHRGFRSGRAIKRAIQYLLAHCAIIGGKHALTWWGCTSYNRLSSKAIEGEFPGALGDRPLYVCRMCGLPLVGVVGRKNDGPVWCKWCERFVGAENRKARTPCPACGCRATEPCLQNVPMRSEYGGYAGVQLVLVHPEPGRHYQARLDESFDAPPSGEAVWNVVKSVLTVDEYGKRRYGLSMGDILHYINGDAEQIRRVVEANLISGRLQKDDSGIISLRHEFTLDKALNHMWFMTTNGIAPRSGDDELRKLLSGHCSETVMDDTTFVFGSIRERFERGCAGVL